MWDIRGCALEKPYRSLRKILNDQRTSRDAPNVSPELENIREAKQLLAQLMQNRVSQLSESHIGKLEKLYFALKPYDQLKETVAHGGFFSPKLQEVVKAIRKKIADVRRVYVLEFPALCETLRKIDDIYGQEPAAATATAFLAAAQRSYYTAEDLGVELARFTREPQGRFSFSGGRVDASAAECKSSAEEEDKGQRASSPK